MSSLVKYRVHEVAKDFGVKSKDLTEILGKYLAAPKNTMHALSDAELDVIFDYLTQQNEISDLSVVFNVTPYEDSAPKPVPEPEPEAVPMQQAETEKAPAPMHEPKEIPQQKTNNTVGREFKPAPPRPVHPPAPAQKVSNDQNKKPFAHQTQKQDSRPAQNLSNNPVQSPGKSTQAAGGSGIRQVEKAKYIDTRGSEINLARYDERFVALVPDRAQNMGQGKEKIKKQPDRKTQQMGQQKRRAEEAEKFKRLQQQEARKKVQLKVLIPDEIAVGELALRLKKSGAEVVKQLMKNGVMASVSNIIDYDTAAFVAIEFGAKVEKEVIITIEERLINDSKDKDEDLQSRSPIVVVMGHVDHGKTSLLDAIRETHVVSGEAGGITQHIGAYTVEVNGRRITFLDTPGHAAFTSMRARGARVTDIAILVVAADDGIMPQTIEAINHAKAAEVPIIVAVNKMDRPSANPDRIMQQLTEYELVPEEWGGETVVAKISALTREGIPDLLEMVLLSADMLELKANPNRSARGTVIEARLDKNRGTVSTLLVQNGSLKHGDIVIAGKAVGRVRAMTDDKGHKIEIAGPSTPVEITGLVEVPDAGEIFHVVEDERMARELVEQRKQEEKDRSSAALSKLSLDDLFSQISAGNVKDLNIIIKADVQGSIEAIRSSLEKLSNDEVRVRAIHGGVGAINESDIMLASASNAIIVGFHVRPDAAIMESAARSKVDIRTYRVIYECVDEIEAAMKGMLAPKFKEQIIGHASIRQTFKVSGVGTIAGCYVTDGKIVRNAKARVVRDSIEIFDGELASLKRFKDDAKEVASGYECGLSLERFNDIKDGDVIEAYIMEEIRQ